MYVVSQVESSNGVGGKRTQTYPFIGMPAQVTRKLGNQLLAQANSAYGFASYSGASADASPTLGVGKRYRVFGTQSSEKSWDLNGAFMGGARTSQSNVDDYNNVGSILVESLDVSGNALSYRKQTLSTYDNDAANWILGRLRKSTVTNTVPSSIPTATVGSAANASTSSGTASNLPPAPPSQFSGNAWLAAVLQTILN